MNDREDVLGRVRRCAAHRVAHPSPYPRPRLDGGWDAFAETLAGAGGEPRGPVARGELARALAKLLEDWGVRGGTVAEPSAWTLLGEGPWRAASEEAAPLDFAATAVAVVAGELGVAENGAVAVAGDGAPHRSLLFLCERLVLLLPVERIVPDMHAAIDLLPEDATRHHHLTWISGPSKTADIEQALVHGAHGPLATAVLGWRAAPQE